MCHIAVNEPTAWPKKVSHYHKSSLNNIKTCHWGYIFHQFGLQNEHMNMMSVLNILCVTWLVASSRAARSCKINASDKTFDSQKKRKYGNKRIFYTNLLL